jgi:type IV pilus assembly protein PilC
MNFTYVAYAEEERKLISGKVSATGEESASELLAYGGYRVLSLKSVRPWFDRERLQALFAKIKPTEIVMFSRQLALLLESGTDIVTALDLLRNQLSNRTLTKIITELASDIRGGSSLSTAMSKHPRAFSPMYYRAIAAGEQGGNLEVVLRQMADYIEKGTVTSKQIRSALTYPVIVVFVTIGVVAILIMRVFPAFTTLYSQVGAQLPTPTRILISLTNWFNHYGLYLLLAVLIIAAAIFLFVRTPAGRYRWDSMMLRFPVIGRIVHLSELSRCCRTVSMLVRIGLPLPEVMAMAIHSSSNKFVAENLTGVQQELIRGEGLSQPMAKRKLFLPLMTQMVKVGEETGNLENTLNTVADNFDMEASDKTKAAVGLIQPIMTLIIGGIVGFVVLAMMSAMYSIYGQMGG